MLGVEVAGADKVCRRFVLMHGLHRSEAAFESQLRSAEQWTSDVGGLVLGDINRIVCRSWRSGALRATLRRPESASTLTTGATTGRG